MSTDLDFSPFHQSHLWLCALTMTPSRHPGRRGSGSPLTQGQRPFPCIPMSRDPSLKHTRCCMNPGCRACAHLLLLSKRIGGAGISRQVPTSRTELARAHTAVIACWALVLALPELPVRVSSVGQPSCPVPGGQMWFIQKSVRRAPG